MRNPHALPFDLQDVPPQRWPETPVVIHHNRLTGLNDGNDEGYRDVPTVVASRVEPLVIIDGDMLTTPEFDGVNMYGKPDNFQKRGGGLEGGGILLRETMARTLRAINAQIRRVFGGEFELVPTDGYRSAVRQQSTFLFMLQQMLSKQGKKIEEMTDEELLQFGRFTDTNASCVPAREDDSYGESFQQLLADTQFLPQLEGEDRVKAVQDYLTISANAKTGRAPHLQIETNATTAHAGGGAVDVNIWGPSPVTGKRVPLVHAPSAFAHPMCGTLFLEKDANFDVFKQLWLQHPEIQSHMQELGYNSPDIFSFKDWEVLRRALRIRHHAFVNMHVRGSYYDLDSPTDANESWHYQIPNIATVDGVTYASPQSAATHPGSGNTCHVKLRLPPGSEAVYGAKDAFEYVEKYYGHASA
jgi:hypothetical protein